MPTDPTFNYEERAAAVEARIDAIPYNRKPGDLNRQEILEHELRFTFAAGWQARVAAEEANIAALLNVNEGEPDPLDEAAKRCFDIVAQPIPSTPARAAIREELRRAFMAGRETVQREAVDQPIPDEKWDAAVAKRNRGGVSDGDLEHLAKLLEDRAAYDIETARRLRELF